MILRSAIAAFLILFANPKPADKRGLDIYFVDTEGGAATLIVTATPFADSQTKREVLTGQGAMGDWSTEEIQRGHESAYHLRL